MSLGRATAVSSTRLTGSEATVQREDTSARASSVIVGKTSRLH